MAAGERWMQKPCCALILSYWPIRQECAGLVRRLDENCLEDPGDTLDQPTIILVLNNGHVLRLHLSLFVVSLVLRLLHLCLRLQVHLSTQSDTVIVISILHNRPFHMFRKVLVIAGFNILVSSIIGTTVGTCKVHTICDTPRPKTTDLCDQET